MSYVRKMIERDKNMRITVGCRCAFKTGSHWAEDFGAGTHVIPVVRDGGDFSVFVLQKGFTGPLTKDIKLYQNKVSWVGEDEMELVDADYSANMKFIDWFDSVYDDICGDCLEAFYNEDGTCPNPKCPSNDEELMADLHSSQPDEI